MEENEKEFPEAKDNRALENQLVQTELDSIGERIRSHFDAGEFKTLGAEEVTQRVAKWFASKQPVGGAAIPPGAVEAKVNPDTGELVMKLDLRYFPWIKPTIRDYLQNWIEKTKAGKAELSIDPDHAANWSREDWLAAFRILGADLSKQMSASPPDMKALEIAEDQFAMFRMLAEACGHSITFGFPEELGEAPAENVPVTFTVEFDYKASE